MKKIIILLFLMFGVMVFADRDYRFVEKCKITSLSLKTMKCKSLESNKVFSFTFMNENTYRELGVGEVYKVFFTGSGYKDLSLIEFYYLY